MLNKNKTNAVILGLITVSAMVIVPHTFDVIRHFRTDPNATSNIISDLFVASLVFLGVVVFAGCVLAAPLIYQLDDSHFGRQGLIRWIIVGLICGTLWQASSWLLDPNTWVVEILDTLLSLASLVLSYWLVFELLWPPTAKDKDTEKTSNS